MHSDPRLSLCHFEPQERIYVVNEPTHRPIQARMVDPHSSMVQPAVVVVDRAGRVRYWWSWNRLQEGAVHADGVLPNAPSARNPTGNTHDVRWRPVPDDLLRRLRDGRDLDQVRVDNVGLEYEYPPPKKSPRNRAAKL